MLHRLTTAFRTSRPVAALCALVVGVSALVTAMGSPASAATATASLSMQAVSWPPASACWTASGYIAMSNYDAEGYLDNGAELRVFMYGDDPAYDDQLYRFSTYENAGGGIRFYGSSRGIEWEWSGCAPRSTLNEDYGEDEIYVRMIAFKGGNEGVLATRDTNIFRASW